MKIDVFCLRVICTCGQCDSPFCSLQLTALIKPNWYVLLYCCVCLQHSLIIVQPSWATVPCPTTKLSMLISKSFVGIKQSVISVALKTPLKNKIANLYLQNFTSASIGWLYCFYIKLSPHILQQNCAHVFKQTHPNKFNAKWFILISKRTLTCSSPERLVFKRGR